MSPAAVDPVDFRITFRATPVAVSAMRSAIPAFISGGNPGRGASKQSRGAVPQRGRSPTCGTVGGGVDYRISDRISVRGEYLYGQSLDTNSVTRHIRPGERTPRSPLGTAYHF